MNADIAKMKLAGKLVGQGVEFWPNGEPSDLWGKVTRMVSSTEVEIEGPFNRKDFAPIAHLVPLGYAKQLAFLADQAAERAAQQ